MLPIRVFGDPVLRQRARAVERVTRVHRRLVRDMIETMREAPGVGLAGPQVGVVERVFVWEVEDDHGAVFNPVITWRSDDTVVEEEGCLSLPGLAYPVERAAEVVVEGLDERGEPVRLEAEDLLARVCQHEIDHLDGVLFVDRLPEDLRRDALRTLRERALGLPPSQPRVAAPTAPEETL
ncbi:MAG TPA: peptide deformylase [Actinomycetota bacterium]|nr:peptide deformylase [Actinomycetota bacterium]